MNHEQEKLGIMGRELENIDLTVSQRKQITALLKLYLPNTEVWAYGSRVKFTARPSSDLDMVAFASKEQSLAVANLKEAFEESSIPFRVDLFVWDEVPEQFHKNIEAERVVLQEKKKQSDLPEGWEERVLGTMLSFANGKKSPSREDSFPFPVYGSNGIIGKSRNTNADSLSLIIGRVGSYCGSVYQTKTKCWVTDNAIRASVIGDNDPTFLFYLLISLNLNNWRGGSGQPLLNQTILSSIPVKVPDSGIQKAIAHILGSLDDKIELNRRMNETLEAMAQALFKSWFVDFDPVIDNALIAGLPLPEELRQKGEIRRGTLEGKYCSLDAASKSSHFKLYHSHFPSEFIWTDEMGWIPKGWRVSDFGEISNCFDSKRIPLSKRQREQKQPGAIPYYGATSVMDYVNEWIFDDIYLLIGEDGSVLKEDGSPFVQYIWGQTWVNNHAHVLQGKSGISTEHLMLFIQSQNITAYVTGAVQLKINQKNMNSIPFLLAGDGLNSFFAGLLNPLYGRKRQILDSNKELSTTRDTLLPQLLSGDMRISEAEKLIEDLNNNGGNNGKS